MRRWIIGVVMFAILLFGAGFWALRSGSYTVANVGAAPLEITLVATRCDGPDFVRDRIIAPGGEVVIYFPVSGCEGTVSILTTIEGCGPFESYIDHASTFILTGDYRLELDVRPNHCRYGTGRF
jgi:hypothetical protein